MADVVETVLKATDQASATTDKVIASMGKYDASLAKAGNTAASVSSNMKDLPLRFDEIGLKSSVSGEALIRMAGATSGVENAFRVATPVVRLFGVALDEAMGPIGIAVLAVTGMNALINKVFEWNEATKQAEIANDKIRASFLENVKAPALEAADAISKIVDNTKILKDALSESSSKLGSFLTDIEKQKIAGETEKWNKALLTTIDTFGLLGPSLGKKLDDAGKVIEESTWGPLFEAQINGVQERLDRLTPEAQASIKGAAEAVLREVGFGADKIAALSDSDLEPALTKAYDMASPKNQFAVTDMLQKIIGALNGAAPLTRIASDNLGDAIVDGVADKTGKLLDLLQQFHDLGGTGGSLPPGGSSTTTVTGSVGEGGGSAGGVIPGGIGGGAIPAGLTGQQNATKSGGGGGGGGGKSGFVNHGTVQLVFSGVSSSNEVLHVLDVMGGQ